MVSQSLSVRRGLCSLCQGKPGRKLYTVRFDATDKRRIWIEPLGIGVEAGFCAPCLHFAGLVLSKAGKP